MEEIAQYTVEEGLHQALVLEFSYGQPNMNELRKLLPKILGVKGKCLVGWLARRHVLIRFDKYEEFVLAATRFVNYLHCNGEEFLFRVFPWSIGFNPKEETSRAFTWISLPNLPPELFAEKSLLSIASAVGKPIAIDKATQEKSRPSTARLKVELDLLDKHPNHIRVQYIDEKSGKVMEHVQEFVFGNLPLFCCYCKHQGHEENGCRLMLGKNVDKNQNVTGNNVKTVEKYQEDAREIINAKLRNNNANGLILDNNGEDAVIGGKTNKV
ncbi:uncharacterized protein LOC132616506 [Lycium barbarum]|uniref:uncharacterized protein LOC132616506 n=1 Tax=Lycium barbarum TaxID=112863 RepID=UPI00293EFAEF|nr:uncharacterized protein LOC132616506 [Lycium barbarum]